MANMADTFVLGYYGNNQGALAGTLVLGQLLALAAVITLGRDYPSSVGM